MKMAAFWDIPLCIVVEVDQVPVMGTASTLRDDGVSAQI
jgi:hypothetical protein